MIKEIDFKIAENMIIKSLEQTIDELHWWGITSFMRH